MRKIHDLLPWALPQGNYINASPETPYLQIGESKYGKPSLDRIVNPQLSLDDGAKLCLVSLESTARSNITVGPPFEISVYHKDNLTLRHRCTFEQDNPYMVQLRETWNDGIRNVFHMLPGLMWEQHSDSIRSADTSNQTDEMQQQPIQQQHLMT